MSTTNALIALEEIRQALGLPHRATPNEIVQEVKAMRLDRDRFKIALSDAIRRPMGVIPVSAEGLVSADEMAAAEERRPKHTPTDLRVPESDDLEIGPRRIPSPREMVKKARASVPPRAPIVLPSLTSPTTEQRAKRLELIRRAAERGRE